MGLTQKLGTIPLAILTDASNNVGIGAAPSGTYKLEVTGTARVSGAATFSSTVQTSGNILAGNDSNTYLEIANGGSIDVKSGLKWMVGSGRTYYGAIELAASSANNSYLSFSTMLSGTVAERMRITNGGNVGIGTASPNDLLQVGSSTTRGTMSIVGTSSGVPVLQLNNTNAASGRAFNLYVGNAAAGSFSIYDTTASLNRFIIDSTGAATFSSNITMGGNTLTSTGATGFTLKTTTTGAWAALYGDTGGLYLGTNAGNWMFINNSGNVGINTTAPTSISSFGKILQIAGGASNSCLALSANSVAGQANIGYDSGTLYIEALGNPTGTNNNIVFSTTSTNSSSTRIERMRITSGGELCVGITSISTTGNGTVITQGSSYANLRLFGTGSQTFAQFFLGGTAIGSITGSGSVTSYNVTSDYRLKQDLKEYNGLNLISAIKTYDYEWKSDNTRAYGVLAHELQEVLPYAVHGKKDAEEMQGVDYSKIVPILVKAIQEMNTKFEEQQATITSLQDRLTKAGL